MNKRGRPKKGQSMRKKCVCEYCHRMFTIPKSYKDRKYCNRECYSKSAGRQSIIKKASADEGSKPEKVNIDRLIEDYEREEREQEDRDTRDNVFLVQAIVSAVAGITLSLMLCYYDICIKTYAALLGIALSLCFILTLPTLIAMGYKWIYKFFQGE